jgi:hypothetical protein
MPSSARASFNDDAATAAANMPTTAYDDLQTIEILAFRFLFQSTMTRAKR